MRESQVSRPRLNGRRSKLIDRVAVYTNHEEIRDRNNTIAADEKFRELLTRAHNDRFVEDPTRRLGTERPRFTPAAPGFIPSASPAHLAAEIGGGGGQSW